jgi:hypothetical protein
VDGGCVLFNESCALVKVRKMSRIWCWGLISLGMSMAIAPSFPATAQFPTVETSSATQVDATFPQPIGAAVLQAAAVESGLR